MREILTLLSTYGINAIVYCINEFGASDIVNFLIVINVFESDFEVANCIACQRLQGFEHRYVGLFAMRQLAQLFHERKIQVVNA